MIYLLKWKTTEEKKEQDYNQLVVMDKIRRENFESSSGVVNETRFQEIIEHIKKVSKNGVIEKSMTLYFFNKDCLIY